MAKIDTIVVDIEVRIPKEKELMLSLGQWFWRNKVTEKEREKLFSIILRCSDGQPK